MKQLINIAIFCLFITSLIQSYSLFIAWKEIRLTQQVMDICLRSEQTKEKGMFKYGNRVFSCKMEYYNHVQP